VVSGCGRYKLPNSNLPYHLRLNICHCLALGSSPFQGTREWRQIQPGGSLIPTEFWTSVREQLRIHDLLTHPFYRAWKAGKLTRPEIGFYGRQYLHHVAAFPTYLTALHCRLPYGEGRKAILESAADRAAQIRPRRRSALGSAPAGRSLQRPGPPCNVSGGSRCFLCL
jgi:hypothetical protein